MIETAARQAGVELDLGHLDPNGDPAEIERPLHERLHAAAAAAENRQYPERSRPRKPAKALHPDLETDPALKIHQEEWMKRLTSAHAAGDLRELLRIEMKWLGEESSNLASAGEEKLNVYILILKEQIAKIKMRTEMLVDQPQYSTLRRFIDDFTGYLPDPPSSRSASPPRWVATGKCSLASNKMTANPAH